MDCSFYKDVRRIAQLLAQMVFSLHPHPVKHLPTSHHFTMKVVLPAPNSMKIKALVRSPVLRHLCHVYDVLTRVKSMLMDLVNKNKTNHDKHKRSKKNSLYGSIRLHHNWCSSHVRPMPDPVTDGCFSSDNAYYDSTWNSFVAVEDGGDCESGPPLSGLPHWLEEKQVDNHASDGDVDEINRLADVFIANCHEKFRLEKQESYRLFQEMLARGL